MVLKAYLLVTTDPGQANDVVHALNDVTGVEWAHLSVGRATITARLQAPNYAELGSVIRDANHIRGVARTETLVQMEAVP